MTAERMFRRELYIPQYWKSLAYPVWNSIEWQDDFKIMNWKRRG
jgi:hypothetical protein